MKSGINSWETFKSQLPGRLGTPVLGTTNPIIVHGTQLSGKLFQRGREGSVTTTGVVIAFSPAFSGAPTVNLHLETPGSLNVSRAFFRNLNGNGGTLSLIAAGTVGVHWTAWDPSR